MALRIGVFGCGDRENPIWVCLGFADETGRMPP